MTQNTRVLLARRPRGEPTDADFEIESQPIPPLADGEILVEILWLSLDPYMRGRMSDRKSYAPPTELGQPITGEAAGVVAQSRSDRWAEGDCVCVQSGWQSYYVTRGDDPAVYAVDAKASPLSTYLGVLGMPGRTAYFGLLRVGKPRAGETVVVSAAAGAVGSAVGQIAKIRGCRAVGVAGGAAKCRHVVDELGFDACVDYKAGNLEADLAAACPDGIDVYFENVGDAVAQAVAPLLNDGARVPICGFISAYNTEDMTKEKTPFDVFGALANPPEHRFFLVFDYVEENGEANAQLAEWLGQGKLKYRESVVDGIENAPAAFRGLLRGKNFGKQLVAVAKE
jgi:NADPH-dependent curcumin reductase CurA